ncbi:MAG: hypothetical protein K1060chlam2_00212 [Chlamydiae bacterium]|nr:hypothetical protein [Chlamydiota bacterium]
MAGDEEISGVDKVSQDTRIQESQKAQSQQRVARMDARQVGSEARLEQSSEMMIFNPRDMHKKFQPLKEKASSRPQGKPSAKSEVQKGAEAGETGPAEQIAEEYFQRNPELQKKTLMMLQQQIKPGDDHEQILEKLQKIYTDKSLADEAIDFLIDVSQTKEALKRKFIKAKQDFNAKFGKDIRAGRNILAQSQAFSKQGLGSATGLRDLYREITGNPREPHKLFEELTKKFKFSDMKNIIDFIMHSLGSDMKAKGPSITRAELQRLFGQARTMQAILGLFRFFYSRMKMIKGQFNRFDLAIPSRLNFDVLARLLMSLLQERYPTPDKILKLAFILGIAEELAAQIIIFSQYRDAMRNISPKLFKSERHRQEVLLALMETLSDLEDEIDYQDEDEASPPPRQPKDTIE